MASTRGGEPTVTEEERLREAFARVVNITAQLARAVKAADLYLNSFDTSPPSRIKAETRLIVEEAMGLLREAAREGAHSDE